MGAFEKSGRENVAATHFEQNAHQKRGDSKLDLINKNVILTKVLDKLISQTNKGVEKYGETVNPDSYETVEWIDHAIEESIDHIVYLTVLKQKIVEDNK